MWKLVSRNLHSAYQNINKVLNAIYRVRVLVNSQSSCIVVYYILVSIVHVKIKKPTTKACGACQVKLGGTVRRTGSHSTVTRARSVVIRE